MSQSRKNYTQTSYDKKRNAEEYIYGSAVRKAVPEEPKREPKSGARAKGRPSARELSRTKRQEANVRKNRERARYMSAGYVMFLAGALTAAALVLVNYIQLRTELTNLTRSVAAKEIEVNNMKIANDEEYNRIISSIDLEEIKRIALGELGMIYAQEGQIISYDNKGSDYMRQVTDGSR